jgi:hypothetical protein
MLPCNSKDIYHYNGFLCIIDKIDQLNAACWRHMSPAGSSFVFTLEAGIYVTTVMGKEMFINSVYPSLL